MKKSNIFKIVTFIIIIIMMIFTITNPSLAAEAAEEEDDGARINFDPNDEIWRPSSTTSAQGADRVLEIGNDIIGVIQLVGSLISVGVLVVIGIRYMMGSVEERASYKKAMTPYLIGAVMLFAITNILAIIVNLVKDGGL